MFADRPRGMSKAGQKAFVQSLSKWILDDIVKIIDDGRIPINWEGEELRLYIAERFVRGCDAKRYATNAIMREYENDVIVRGL